MTLMRRRWEGLIGSSPSPSDHGDDSNGKKRGHQTENARRGQGARFFAVPRRSDGDAPDGRDGRRRYQSRTVSDGRPVAQSAGHQKRPQWLFRATESRQEKPLPGFREAGIDGFAEVAHPEDGRSAGKLRAGS